MNYWIFWPLLIIFLALLALMVYCLIFGKPRWLEQLTTVVESDPRHVRPVPIDEEYAP